MVRTLLSGCGDRANHGGGHDGEVGDAGDGDGAGAGAAVRKVLVFCSSVGRVDELVGYLRSSAGGRIPARPFHRRVPFDEQVQRVCIWQYEQVQRCGTRAFYF